MKYIYDDGGREAAGFKGHAGDCVCRAIAIATEQPYKAVYSHLNEFIKGYERRNKKSSSRTGVNIYTIRRYMIELGWEWTPTMFIGSGCQVHLRDSELPAGRLVVNVSKHTTAVIDGVLHDTYDCSRDGMRCVYGYYARV